LYRLSHPLGIRVYSGAPHFQIIASLRQTPVQLFILFGYSLAPLHIFTTSTSTRPLGLAAARDRRLHPVPCGHARQDNIHAGAVGRPVADRSDVTAAAVGGGEDGCKAGDEPQDEGQEGEQLREAGPRPSATELVQATTATITSVNQTLTSMGTSR
jgi:hypothetical protein